MNYRLLLVLLVSLLPVFADGQEMPLDAAGAESPFRHAQWIGAIRRADCHLPQGRTYTGTALKDSSVKAAWAAVPPLSRRSIYVQRRISFSGRVVEATIYVCGLGFYELSINGRRVGEDVMSPAWSDYEKTLYYNEFDVTPLLSRCTSAQLRVLLGNGFYNEQGGRYHKMKLSFGPPTLLLRLHVRYSDGGEADFVSDGSWQWTESPLTFNSIYGGEDYDARLEHPRTWHPICVQEPPGGELRLQAAYPMRVMERYEVSRRVDTTDGTLVLDMGQNLAGFPAITLSGRQGQTVRLTPSETLTPEGRANQRQTGRPHYYTYTIGRRGTHTWQPRFSYYGFRYIEVEGAVMEGDPNPDGLPVLRRVQSCFVSNAAPTTGHFECSNPLFNDAARLIDRAVRSNWQAVWTDCPHREKLGWLEQDWLCAEGLLHTYDCRTMIEQTLQNIADAQHADGAVPTTAPQYAVFPGETWGKPFNESPEWGGTFVYLPMAYWRHYGSDTLIRRYYEPVRRYVDYLCTQSHGYLLTQGLGDWYDYVPGEKAGFARNTTVRFVSTAHLYRWTRDVSTMAALIGRSDDAARYALRADSIRQAINDSLCTDWRYDTGSQCAQAIALDLRLMPDSARHHAYALLLNDIHAHGDRLSTGDIGNRYLFRTLAYSPRREHHELLYRMLNHYEVPGYGYQIRQGHTTLTEQWDPTQGSSMNHFMMGHLANLLIPRFLGIEVVGGDIPLRVAPMPVGDLTWCRGWTECPYGRVSSEWHRTDGVFTLILDLPEGARARIVLPRSGREIVVSVPGRHTFTD